MKSILIATALFFATAANAATMTLNFEGDYELTQTDMTLLDQTGLTEEIRALLVNHDVSITFDFQIDDGAIIVPFGGRDGMRETRRERNEKPCKITVKDKRSGSGRIGHKRLGGEGRGTHDREITVEVPCDEVKDILKLILNEG